MTKRNKAHQQVPDEAAELRNRLEETEETLRAIRQYMVDAFVVTQANGVKVVTLNEADFPYRIMVESMNEGAVTLIPDGTIFYCNPRFGQMIQREAQELVGVRFQDLIPTDQQDAFNILFNQAERHGSRGEFCLQMAGGDCVPVQLSIYHIATDEFTGISIIATDITERMRSEEKIRSLASELTRAEQEERHRISQILHDDLQQRLFAIKAQLVLLRTENDENGISPSMQAHLNQLQGWLSDTITITRNLSIDLSPIVLQGEGLTEAITWLSAQMKEQYDLQIYIDAKESFSNLDSHMRVLLFQAVRELLFNIVKHASSAQATVTLEQKDGLGRITIADKGKGFDAAAVMNDPKTSHGLLIIQDRLSLMGGSMEVTSKPGEGTIVVIETQLGKPDTDLSTG
ncbi:MAG TPA: PAS domain S-box protein [Anaerolineales bacterium]|jgi:PAS domain S-box-containing protein|nr:PAS domain S-box protein [Anaerolineales bacterium]